MAQGYGNVNFNFQRNSPMMQDWYGEEQTNPLTNIVFGNDDEEDDPLQGAEDYLGYTDPRSSPYIQRMNEVMSQRQPAMEQYMANMAQQPLRENYQPNTMTKIAAALAGVSAGIREGAGEGIKVGQATRMLPWQQAYDDWRVKDQSYGAAAKMEQEKLKQLLDDLAKMGDTEVKFENANTAKAGARARLSTAGSYKRMVDQPHIVTFSDATGTYQLNTKTGERKYVGESAAAAQRKLTASEGAANRRNTREIAEFEEGGRNQRNTFNQVAETIRGKKTSERIFDAGQRRQAESYALASMKNNPKYARFSDFIVPDDAMNKAKGKELGVTFFMKTPPVNASGKNLDRYNEFLKALEEETRAQFMSVPTQR